MGLIRNALQQWKARLPNTVHTEAYRRLVDVLRNARVDIGVTQQSLAEAIGKPQSFIAKYEGYERRLDVIEFLAIAKELGVDPIEPVKKEFRVLKLPLD